MFKEFNSLFYFMLYMPFYYFFLVRLMLRTLISVSSCNWLFVWAGLEINLLSFIPIIVCRINNRELERALKYFLVQALGSSLVLLGSFIYLGWAIRLASLNLGTCIIFSRIIIKLGIFPFHYWLPHVIGGLGWVSCILLSTWQKLGPLFIIRSVVEDVQCWFFFVAGAIGSLIGGLGGLNQSQIRVLLAYSSVGHLGWIFIAIIESLELVLQYYIIYRIINLSIIGFLHFIPTDLVNFRSYGFLPTSCSIYFCIIFLSLGGLPPFIGFYPKFIVLKRFVGGLFLVVPILILVLGSLLRIFYYLNIFINLFIKSYLSGFNVLSFSFSFFLSFIISLSFIITLLGLFVLI